MVRVWDWLRFEDGRLGRGIPFPDEDGIAVGRLENAARGVSGGVETDNRCSLTSSVVCTGKSMNDSQW